jgi:hypothetical protein
MTVRTVLLLTLLALGACASQEAPLAQGPWHPLNTGKWAFNSNMLTQPPTGFSP